MRLVDHQHRLAGNLHIARVPEERDEFLQRQQIILIGMMLADDHLAIAAIPAPRPVLVCPQAHERGVDIGFEKIRERLEQQLLALKIVVVEAEALDPVRLRQLDLLMQHLFRPQIVIS